MGPILRWLCLMALVFAAAPGVLGQKPDRDAPEATTPRPFDQTPRVIEMNAGGFEFTPSPIHVKVGENIQLKVTSTDKTHGIHINPFPDGATPNTPPGLEFLYGEDCWKMKKGQTAKIEFVAHGPGTYSFSCCKQCGSGHKRMKGQIIVEP